MNVINDAEFAAWLHHPVTAQIMQYLRDRRANLQEALVEGEFTHETTDGTAQRMARIIGECQTLRDVYELSYVDILNFYNINIEEKDD